MEVSDREFFQCLHSLCKEGARVRVQVVPRGGPSIVLLIAAGSLVGVQCGELGPRDALLAFGRYKHFAIQSEVDEAIAGAPLMRRESLLTWMITLGKTVPRVVPEVAQERFVGGVRAGAVSSGRGRRAVVLVVGGLVALAAVAIVALGVL